MQLGICENWNNLAILVGSDQVSLAIPNVHLYINIYQKCLVIVLIFSMQFDIRGKCHALVIRSYGLFFQLVEENVQIL